MNVTTTEEQTMIKAISLIVVGIAFLSLSATAENYDDWKAPPPMDLPDRGEQKRKLKPHQEFVNEIIELERLPYIITRDHGLKVAINPQVLSKYNLKSGDEVSIQLMYKIIEADRRYQKGY